MHRFIFPLTARESTDAGRFGPKVANLARLSQSGLPTPGGFCLDAEAYRAQIRALVLESDARGVFSALESAQARRHSLMMKLGLLDQPITPAVLDPLLAAWYDLQARTGALTVVRSSALTQEPPSGSPLFGRDNMIVTPDTSFCSEESLVDLQTKAAEEVVRVLSGQAPRNPVNPKALKTAQAI